MTSFHSEHNVDDKRNPDARPIPPAPLPPIKPDPDDCCRSGCVPCVFDLYADELDRFERDLRDWRQRYGTP